MGQTEQEVGPAANSECVVVVDLGEVSCASCAWQAALGCIAAVVQVATCTPCARTSLKLVIQGMVPQNSILHTPNANARIGACNKGDQMMWVLDNGQL